MLLLGSALAGLVIAGPGQFGFNHAHRLAHCEVTPNSFTVGDMKFVTGPERTGFVVTNLSRHQKTLSMRPSPMAPVRIIYETGADGFSMEYRAGAVFEVAGSGAPFVSWSDGSVGPGIPSAPSKWAMLTWPTAKQPVLLLFASKDASVDVTEVAGGFRIEIPKFAGIMRVRIPFGNQRISASNAAELGDLVAKVSHEVERLSKPAPRIVGFEVVETERGLLATWTFDASGTLLPRPLVAGLKAGCVKLLSEKKQVLSGDFVCSSKELSALFLTRMLRPGQPFVRGAATVGTIVDGGDYRAVAQAALDYLCGNWSGAANVALASARAAYALDLEFIREPLSEAMMPFEADGKGSALAAAHALAASAFDEPTTWLNGLLASLDWVSWLPAGATPSERLDSAVLLSLACALRKEPEAQLIGAMANCGALATSDAPLSELRAWAYPGPGSVKADWTRAMESPVRLLSKAMSIVDVPGVGFSVSGVVDSVRGFDIAFESDQPLKIVNMIGLEQALIIADETPTIIRVKPSAAGPWSVRLARRSPGLPIPKGAPSPRYSASPR